MESRSAVSVRRGQDPRTDVDASPDRALPEVLTVDGQVRRCFRNSCHGCDGVGATANGTSSSRTTGEGCLGAERHGGQETSGDGDDRASGGGNTHFSSTRFSLPANYAFRLVKRIIGKKTRPSGAPGGVGQHPREQEDARRAGAAKSREKSEREAVWMHHVHAVWNGEH